MLSTPSQGFPILVTTKNYNRDNFNDPIIYLSVCALGPTGRKFHSVLVAAACLRSVCCMDYSYFCLPIYLKASLNLPSLLCLFICLPVLWLPQLDSDPQLYFEIYESHWFDSPEQFFPLQPNQIHHLINIERNAFRFWVPSPLWNSLSLDLLLANVTNINIYCVMCDSRIDTSN